MGTPVLIELPGVTLHPCQPESCDKINEIPTTRRITRKSSNYRLGLVTEVMKIVSTCTTRS